MFVVLVFSQVMEFLKINVKLLAADAKDFEAQIKCMVIDD